MEKTIYADIDSTLLDFSTAFGKFLTSKGINVHLDLRQERGLSKLGIDLPTEIALVHEFFSSEEIFTLSPLDHAVEIVRKLSDEGWEFIAISACPSSENISNGRKENLEAVFEIPFVACHTTGIEGCKKSVLEAYDPTIWIEDNYTNALVGHQLGYRTFLLDYAYNQSGPECPLERVSNWKEIYEKICMAT